MSGRPRGERWRLLHRPAHPDSVSAWCLRYLEAVQVAGISAHTHRAREHSLAEFNEWCVERAIDAPRSITKPIIERYQRHLYYYRKADGEPLSIGRQLVALAHVRAFFGWLARHNHILYNPAADIDLPKKPRRILPVPLTPDEAEQILDQPDVATARGLRDRAILELFYATGLRRSELAQLTIYTLHLSDRIVHVRQGKGRKDRLVPMGERAADWVRRYLHESRPRFLVDPQETALFLNRFGRAFADGGLTFLVRRHLKSAGITKGGSCHLFRHTVATQMLNNGADVRFIQQLLGHENLDTTQQYTHVSIEQLKKVHAATHPGNRNADEAESSRDT